MRTLGSVISRRVNVVVKEVRSSIVSRWVVPRWVVVVVGLSGWMLVEKRGRAAADDLKVYMVFTTSPLRLLSLGHNLGSWLTSALTNSP